MVIIQFFGLNHLEPMGAVNLRPRCWPRASVKPGDRTHPHSKFVFIAAKMGH